MRAALKTRLWPKTGDFIQIPYTIDHSKYDTSERANIARAIDEYEEKTCIR